MIDTNAAALATADAVGADVDPRIGWRVMLCKLRCEEGR